MWDTVLGTLVGRCIVHVHVRMAILDLVQYIDTHVCQYFRFIVYYKCINGQNSATPVPDIRPFPPGRHRDASSREEAPLP